jgi:lipopolysaccharide export system protein LptA
MGGPIVIACFLLCAYGVRAQSEETKPIVLTHADSLIGKVIEGETVREVVGNVEFVQGDVVVRCGRAVHYPSRNYAELFGRVSVVRDTVTLTAPRGAYDGNMREARGFDGVRMWNRHIVLTALEGRYRPDEHIAYFRNLVKVVDSTTTITARELTYYEDERRSVAVGDVEVVSARDNGTMFGGLLEHFDDRRYSKMSERPKFVQIDTSSAGAIDTLVIVARQMEAYDDSVRRFIATDSVRLVRGPLSGMSREGIYFSERDFVILRGLPVIWYEENQVTGDSATIQLRKRRLEGLFVFGNAFATSRSDSSHPSRVNQQTSRTMTLYFSNDKLQRIEAHGMAVSLYFLYEDGRPNGVNRSSGDRIIVYSPEGTAEKIVVSGGTEGQYFPENLVSGSEASYNLPGFLWRTDRPTLSNDLNIVELPTTNEGERVGK